MPGVVPYGPKTIRKYKHGRVATNHRSAGMEDGPISQSLKTSNLQHTCQKQPIQVARHNREHLPAPSKDTLKTSTQLIKKAKQENLTLWDWLTVYAYVNTLPQPINQGEVVQYFATRPQGALLFSQPTLSCKLRQCPEMEAHVDSIPNALSSK